MKRRSKGRKGGRRKRGGAMNKYKSVMNIAKRAVKDIGIGAELRGLKKAGMKMLKRRMN
jgi:hypothetical protein